MADAPGGQEEGSEWQTVSGPEYLREVKGEQFVNISIKCYEKKTSTGFPREEYYGFHIVSMYVRL